LRAALRNLITEREMRRCYCLPGAHGGRWECALCRARALLDGGEHE
jgi:hypothetical protein